MSEEEERRRKGLKKESSEEGVSLEPNGSPSLHPPGLELELGENAAVTILSSRSSRIFH